MIGVKLKTRRDEFLDFVRVNPILYEEILDITDTTALSKYELLLIEGPAIIAGPFSVIDVKDTRFDILLADFVQISQEVRPLISNSYCRALDLFQTSYRFDIRLPEGFTLNEELKIDKVKPVVQPIANTDYRPFSSEEENTAVFAAAAFDLTKLEPEPKSVLEHEPELKQPIPELQVTPSNQDSAAIVDPRLSVIERNNHGQGVIRSHGVQKVSIKGREGGKRSYVFPIHIFSSLSDKAGVTAVAFMLAKTFALADPSSKVLYLDLNISNPNSILNTLQLNPDTDAYLCLDKPERLLDLPRSKRLV